MAVYTMRGVSDELVVYNDRLTITPKGLMGLMNKGLKGTKTIPFQSITAIQFKRAGLTSGYIQFTLAGGTESKRGIFAAASDENTFMFSRNNELVEKIKAHIESRLQVRNPSPEQTSSSINDLVKLGELREKGLLTEDEFLLAKQKLINISHPSANNVDASELPPSENEETSNQLGYFAVGGTQNQQMKPSGFRVRPWKVAVAGTAIIVFIKCLPSKSDDKEVSQHDENQETVHHESELYSNDGGGYHSYKMDGSLVGSQWPLKVNNVTIRCYKEDEVIFETADGKKFRVYGLPFGWDKDLDDLKSSGIWIEEPILGGGFLSTDPIKDLGLATCKDEAEVKDAIALLRKTADEKDKEPKTAGRHIASSERRKFKNLKGVFNQHNWGYNREKQLIISKRGGSEYVSVSELELSADTDDNFRENVERHLLRAIYLSFIFTDFDRIEVSSVPYVVKHYEDLKHGKYREDLRTSVRIERSKVIACTQEAAGLSTLDEVIDIRGLTDPGKKEIIIEQFSAAINPYLHQPDKRRRLVSCMKQSSTI